MKRIFKSLKNGLLVSALPLLASMNAYAIIGNINTGVNVNGVNVNKIGNANSVFGVGGVIDDVTTFLLVVLVVIAGIFFVWSGFLYMSSGGDPEKVKNAKNKLIYAAIGLAVGLLAKGLFRLVANLVIGL